MRNSEFKPVREQFQKEISHMRNGGARKDTVIQMVVAKMINANTTFTSDQIRILFEMVW